MKIGDVECVRVNCPHTYSGTFLPNLCKACRSDGYRICPDCHANRQKGERCETCNNTNAIRLVSALRSEP